MEQLISSMSCDEPDEIPEWILLQLWYQKMAWCKVLHQHLNHRWQKKEGTPTLLSSSECITLLVDDTGSKYTFKPTTLYYYEYNYHGRSLMLVNLLLKVFLIHFDLHINMQWNISFESVFFFFLQSLCFHTKVSLSCNAASEHHQNKSRSRWGG